MNLKLVWGARAWAASALLAWGCGSSSGSSGGGGGTGGMSSAQSVEALAQQYCSQLADCQALFVSQAQCEDNFTLDPASEPCAVEVEAHLRCRVDNINEICATMNGSPASCRATSEAIDTCMASLQPCIRSTGPICHIMCNGQTSMDCTPPSDLTDYWTCTCMGGPNSGSAMTFASCPEEEREVVEGFCPPDATGAPR